MAVSSPPSTTSLPPTLLLASQPTIFAPQTLSISANAHRILILEREIVCVFGGYFLFYFNFLVLSVAGAVPAREGRGNENIQKKQRNESVQLPFYLSLQKHNREIEREREREGVFFCFGFFLFPYSSFGFVI